MDKTVDNILQEYDLIRAMSCDHMEKKSAVQMEHCLQLVGSKRMNLPNVAVY